MGERKLISKAGIFLLIGAAGIVFLLALAHLPYVQDRVWENVRLRLGEAGFDASASRFRYNLLDPSVRIEDLDLASTDTSVPTVLAADEVFVSLSLRRLLTGQLAVERAVIDNLVLSFRIDESGRSNWPPGSSEGSSGSLPSVPDIDLLLVEGGAFTFADEARGIVVDLPSWRLSAGSLGQKADVRLTVPPGGRMIWRERGLDLGEITSDFGLSPEQFVLRSFEFDTGVGSLSGQGSVADPLEPVFDLNLQTAFDLAGVMELAGVTTDATGAVRAEAHLANGLGDLEVKGTLASEDLAVMGMPDVRVESAWTWDRPTSRLSIGNLALESGALTSLMSGELALEEGYSRIEARIAALDLDALSVAMGWPVEIASRLSGQVRADWPALAWESAAGNARFDLEAMGSASRTRLPLSGRVGAQGSADAFRIALENVSAPELELSGDARVVGEDIEGDFRLASADVGALGATAVDLFGEGEGLDPEVLPRGPVAGTVRLAGLLSDPEVRFDLDTPRISYSGVEAAEIQAAGRYRGGLLDLERVVLEWQGQAITASGSVDFGTGSPAPMLRVQARDVSIPDVLSGLGSSTPVDGRADLDAVLAGTFEAPEAQVDLSASELVAWDHPFGELDARVAFDPLGVSVEPFDWRLASNPSAGGGLIQGTGRFGYDGSLALELEGQSVGIDELALPGLDALRGTIGFRADVGGSLENPEGQFEISSGGTAYGGSQIGELRLTGEVRDRRLVVDIEAPAFALTGTAQAGLDAPHSALGFIRFDGSDLSRLAELSGLSRTIEGSLTGVFRSDAEVLNWRDGSYRLELEAVHAIVDETAFDVARGSVIRYQDNRVWADQVGLIAAGQRLMVAGSLPLDSEMPEAALNVTGMLDLPAAASLLPEGPVAEVEGVAEIEIVVTGSLRDPRAEADVAVAGASFAAEGLEGRVTGVDADIAVRDNEVTVDRAQAVWGGGRIETRGTFPLSIFSGAGGSGPLAALAVRVSDLGVEALPGLPPGLEGELSFGLDVGAGSLTLEAIQARIELDRLDLRFNGLEFTQEAPIRATLDAGRIDLEPFRITGPETRLEGRGELSLLDVRRVRAQLSADTNTLVLASASGDVASSGRIELRASVDGTLDVPEFSGSFRLEDAEVHLAEPAVEILSLEASIAADANSIVLESLSGSLNGGTLEASGSAAYSPVGVSNARIGIAVEGVFMEAPEGLETFSNAEIDIRSVEDLIEVGGQVDVIEGAFTRDIALDRLLLDYVGPGREALQSSEPDGLLSRVRFDIDVDTLNPIIVDNNVAQLEATANLQVVGSYDRPGLLGRIALAEGGAVRIQENRFLIDRGTIDFTSPNRIEPALSIVAQTEVRDESITLQIDGGGASDLTTTLSSETGLSEPNIVSLLLTGRTLDKVRGAELNVAQEQALSYLTGSLGGAISRGAERALGLSSVRIEPNLIANESDPGARLTIGQEVTRSLELIYSMNLNDSGDQIWIAEYQFDRDLSTRGIRQEDNTYRLELRHDLKFGGTSRASAGLSTGGASGRRVREVVMDPETFDDRSLADVFGVDPGDTYDFFEVRNGTERLRDYFADRGHLETRVRIDREAVDEDVRLNVNVEAGPVVQFDFTAMEVDDDLENGVRDAWRDAGFEALRVRDATRQLRSGLIDDGFLQAQIDSDSDLADGTRRVRFLIDPGPWYRDVAVEFPGASGIAPESLRSSLEDAGLWERVHTERDDARQVLLDLYEARGFLDASVGDPEYRFDPERQTARLLFPIEEGSRYSVAGVEFDGNRSVSGEILSDGLLLSGPLTRARLDEAEQHIEEQYWEQGFNDVRIGRSFGRVPGEARVEVRFSIEEGVRSVVEDVQILGNRTTDASLARNQIDIDSGEPLNYARLNESRRSIYQTGAYSLVEIETMRMEDGVGAGPGPETRMQPVRVRFNVTEIPPYSLRYGGFYDNERGPGIIADLENRGLLGGARVLGVRSRYDAELREFRTYMSQPALKGMPFETNVSAFISTEKRSDFEARSRGFSLQQQTRLGDRILFSYGYRFENTKTTEVDDLGVEQVSRLDVAPLTFSLSRDMRDDPIDASMGSFTSHAVEYAVPALGSDIALLRYFGQVFYYLPLSSPSTVPLSGGIRRSRVVFATGVRFGLVGGLGDAVAPREKFFAGGGTTIRGFAEDSVGPLEVGSPAGGDAMLVLNNEIRFPLFSLLEGVGFADAGNVYRGVSDFDPFDLRTSGGFGLRLRTPWFLLRADYGFNFSPRPEEKPGAFFFSIGQAF